MAILSVNHIFGLATLSILFLLIILIWSINKKQDKLPITYKLGLFWICFSLFSATVHIQVGDFDFPLIIISIGAMTYTIFQNNSSKIFFLTKSNISKSVVLGILIGASIGCALRTIYSPPTTAWSILIFLIPVNEELAFRSLLLGHLVERVKTSQNLANLIQSGLFTLAHLPRYYDQPYYLIIVFIIGILLGIITNRTKNITGSIIGHLLINILSIYS